MAVLVLIACAFLPASAAPVAKTSLGELIGSALTLNGVTVDQVRKRLKPKSPSSLIALRAEQISVHGNPLCSAANGILALRSTSGLG